MRFQDWFEKVLISDQLTTMAVERSPETEEAESPMISDIPDEKFGLEKG